MDSLNSRVEGVEVKYFLSRVEGGVDLLNRIVGGAKVERCHNRVRV